MILILSCNEYLVAGPIVAWKQKSNEDRETAGNGNFLLFPQSFSVLSEIIYQKNHIKFVVYKCFLFGNIYIYCVITSLCLFPP